jgi:type IV fimbrial biogenesis protein FimT
MTNRKVRGVTMIEICVVCSVVALLTGAAVPSFTGAIERHAVQGAAAEFKTDVEFARSKAATRSSSVAMSFHTDAAGSCYVVHTGPQGDCRCDVGGATQCVAGAEPLRTAVLPQAGRVSLSSNVRAMLFNANRGTVSPAGSVTFSGNSGAALREIVSVMGRTRSCSPNSSIPGYKACR